MVITVNGAKHDIPVCFEQVTARQYERIVSEWDMDKPWAERDYFKLFCILADVEFTAFLPDTETEQTIWNTIRWVIEQPFEFTEDMPAVVGINEKIITIPRRIGALSIGQNIHLRQLLEGSKYIEQKISHAVAIYLQPLYDDKPFDFDRAMELRETIADMPAYLIRPIGFFLLMRALPAGKMRVGVWQKIRNSLRQTSRKILQPSRRYHGYNLLKI